VWGFGYVFVPDGNKHSASKPASWRSPASAPPAGAPRTLLWRIFLLVAVLMLASVGRVVGHLQPFRPGQQARQTAQTVVSIINLTRTALLNADPALRKDLLLDLATLEGIRIYPAEAQDKTTPMDDTAVLRRSPGRCACSSAPTPASPPRGKGCRLLGELPHRADDPADTGDFWVMLPIERVMRPHAREWMWWGAAASAWPCSAPT
jgi:two-component system osmolarity sensor histidine kinase EnvZ